MPQQKPWSSIEKGFGLSAACTFAASVLPSVEQVAASFLLTGGISDSQIGDFLQIPNIDSRVSASEASCIPSGRARHPEPELDTTSRSSSAFPCLLWHRMRFSTRIQASPAGTDTDLFHRHCVTSSFLRSSFNCKGFGRIWGRVPSDIALRGRG